LKKLFEPLESRDVLILPGLVQSMCDMVRKDTAALHKKFLLKGINKL